MEPKTTKVVQNERMTPLSGTESGTAFAAANGFACRERCSGAELERELRGLWQRTEPVRPACAVLVLGMDRFRRINELLGYEAGDAVFSEISSRIRRWCESWALTSHSVEWARVGGDEFSVLFWPCSDIDTAVEAAHGLLLKVTEPPVLVGERELHPAASCGVHVLLPEEEDSRSGFRLATEAMVRAKLRGGNVVEVFGDGDILPPERRYTLENALRRAVEMQQFRLRFQPIVDRECRLDGMEALLAWDHPTLGAVNPELFIRLAEETGVILSIGRWVLHEACRLVKSWNQQRLRPPRISVNVSAIQFAAPGFVESVEAILAEYDLAGSHFEFEITESALLRDLKEAAERMARIRSYGITVSVDDFGVGYSPLTYLQELPLDAVKIDRAFIRQIAQPSGSLALIHTIAVLAHHRGLKVVAEGVETPEEMELVRASRCDRMQGYLFGRPLSRVDTETLLTNPEAWESRFRETYKPSGLPA